MTTESMIYAAIKNHFIPHETFRPYTVSSDQVINLTLITDLQT